MKFNNIYLIVLEFRVLGYNNTREKPPEKGGK